MGVGPPHRPRRGNVAEDPARRSRPFDRGPERPAPFPPPRIARWLLWFGLALASSPSPVRSGAGWRSLSSTSPARSSSPSISRARCSRTDVKPSRLERAKLLITSLLEKLKGERVGLVVFAGTAFLQSPLSADYEILREFLPALGPDYLP
jgi:Ca-activated chloride channel family protein